jgi:hypothetical protein
MSDSLAASKLLVQLPLEKIARAKQSKSSANLAEVERLKNMPFADFLLWFWNPDTSDYIKDRIDSENPLSGDTFAAIAHTYSVVRLIYSIFLYYKELVNPYLLTVALYISPLHKEYDVIRDVIFRTNNKLTHNKTVLGLMPTQKKYL